MSTIEERLERVEQKLDVLLALLKSSGGAPKTNTASGGEIEADIDGPRGDPEVRFVPRRWNGADFKGQKFSACDPEFLDMLAEAYEWFAQRDDEAGAVDKNGTPKSRWSRLDGARARAWSVRLRQRSAAATEMPVMSAAPTTPTAAPRSTRATNGNGKRSRASTDYGDDNDIPF
jgi:hypothetical protein